MPLDFSTQLLYDEYVRISNLCDSHVKDEHNDFKLLGGVGLLIPALPAVLKYFKEDYDPLLLLAGFLAILVFFVVIAFKDLLRLSIISFYMKQFKEYEEELRKTYKSKDNTNKILNIAGSWKTWTSETHGKISRMFYIIIGVAIVFLPVFILWGVVGSDTITITIGWRRNYVYACIYFIISVICVILYASAALKLGKSRKKIY